MDMRRIMLYKPGDHIFWHDPDRDISTKPIVIQTIRFFPDANEVEVTADDLFHYHGTPDVFTPLPLHIVVPGHVKHGGYCIGPFSTEDLAKAAGRRMYTQGEGWTTGVVFEERDDTAPVDASTVDASTVDDVAVLFQRLLSAVDGMGDCEDWIREQMSAGKAEGTLRRLSELRRLAAQIRAVVE